MSLHVSCVYCIRTSSSIMSSAVCAICLFYACNTTLVFIICVCVMSMYLCRCVLRKFMNVSVCLRTSCQHLSVSGVFGYTNYEKHLCLFYRASAHRLFDSPNRASVEWKCMILHVCICMYKHIYTSLRVCVRLFTCMYICMYIHVYMYIRTHSYMCTCMCTHNKHEVYACLCVYICL